MRHRTALLLMFASAALAGLALVPKRPLLVWNTMPSIPVGLYIVLRSSPSRAELALIEPPPKVRALATARHYLGHRSFLIKSVAAVSGDRVCRARFRVWISGYTVVTARVADAQRRPLPIWRGCQVLGSGQIFILGDSSDSFDSRYFGPIGARYVIGIAVPIMTIP